MSRPQIAGQGDLFAEQEEADQAAKAATAPCIYDSPARGAQAREAEFEAWCAEHGRFGSYRRSHGWRPVTGAPAPTDRCQVWTLAASGEPNDQCEGHGEDLSYKGCCLGCDWEGPVRSTENEAAEDGCDHAWPSWRGLPVIAELKPSDDKRAKTWVKHVKALYPPGWVDAGGPVRTLRQPGATRSHYAHEWRGFDMCGEVAGYDPLAGSKEKS